MDGPTTETTTAIEGPRPSARDLLLEIELDATLQFGTRELPLKDVLALSLGDVLELNRNVNEPVDLVVGDRIVARGEVVIVDGNFALLVTACGEDEDGRHGYVSARRSGARQSWLWRVEVGAGME
jgi:flagellar motor switch protein FliN/FliY